MGGWSDRRHEAERLRLIAEAQGAHHEAVRSIRFVSSGEIYYLIASVLEYAPFVNRIHVITDRQRPEFLASFAEAGLCEPGFLRIVDHATVFSGLDAPLPTFNSRAIEAVMWRIPGLSERFLYCNDDFFFNRPLTFGDFFRNGVPLLRGSFIKPSHCRLSPLLRMLLRRIHLIPWRRPSFAFSVEKGAMLAGMKERLLRIGHHPHPLRRSTFASFYGEHPGVLARQISHRIRNIEQHNPVSLANHLELKVHGAEVAPP